jgi:hypothetical protein
MEVAETGRLRPKTTRPRPPTKLGRWQSPRQFFDLHEYATVCDANGNGVQSDKFPPLAAQAGSLVNDGARLWFRLPLSLGRAAEAMAAYEARSRGRANLVVRHDMGLATTRRVEVGEELFLHYGTDFWLVRMQDAASGAGATVRLFAHLVQGLRSQVGVDTSERAAREAFRLLEIGDGDFAPSRGSSPGAVLRSLLHDVLANVPIAG